MQFSLKTRHNNCDQGEINPFLEQITISIQLQFTVGLTQEIVRRG